MYKNKDEWSVADTMMVNSDIKLLRSAFEGFGDKAHGKSLLNFRMFIPSLENKIFKVDFSKH